MVIDASDPLFDPEMLFGDMRPSETLRRRILDEGWFPARKPAGKVSRRKGRKVAWLNESGRKLRKVSADQVMATHGNEFDPQKLATYAWMMRRGEIPLSFVPTGYFERVTLTDVVETQSEDEDDRGYDGRTRPFTTGDEDLDAYLSDPEGYLEGYWIDNEEQTRKDMEAAKAKASRSRQGDVGGLVVTLNSGNHRAFAAFLAGEPAIWVLDLDPSSTARPGPASGSPSSDAGPRSGPRSKVLSW